MAQELWRDHLRFKMASGVYKRMKMLRDGKRGHTHLTHAQSVTINIYLDHHIITMPPRFQVIFLFLYIV